MSTIIADQKTELATKALILVEKCHEGMGVCLTFDLDFRVALEVIVTRFPRAVVETEHCVRITLPHLHPPHTLPVHELCITKTIPSGM